MILFFTTATAITAAKVAMVVGSALVSISPLVEIARNKRDRY